MSDSVIMFIGQIFNGLKIGSVYSLVALGYTMVYGIIRLINFAHGDFIMVGSYALMLTIPFIIACGLPAWFAVIPAVLVCVAVGIIVERAAYKPVREKGNNMTALITAIAMSLLLENGSQALFGADYQTVPTIVEIPTLVLGKLKIDGATIITVLLGIAINGLWIIAIPLLFSPKILKKLCGGVTKLLLKCTFLKKRENYIEKVHGFEADFSSYTMKFRSKMRYVLLAILWSIPQVILQMSVLYVVFRAFSLDLPYGELLCMQTMLQASVCFIPLPGASGAQELGFSMFFKSYFASGDILYTAVLVWRFFTYYIIVLLGALVVVIDQLVFGCRRKQEAALSAGKE